MHRLVMWGFVLALIPLALAFVWEIVAMARTTFTGQFAGKPTPSSVPGREPSVSERT